jgi:hypothetical protein
MTPALFAFRKVGHWNKLIAAQIWKGSRVITSIKSEEGTRRKGRKKEKI